MDEPTPTGVVTPEAGGEQPLPAPSDTQAPAVTPPADEPSEPTKGEPEAPAESPLPIDDKLKNFAKANGIEDVSELSERELKLLKVARDNQVERRSGAPTELNKSVRTASDAAAEIEAAETGQDAELLKTVRGLQVENTVNKFWSTPFADGNYPDKALEQAMIEEVQAKPYLAGDLEALYATASFKSGNTASLKTAGGREALETLARSQQAAVPNGHATNQGTTPPGKKFEDLSLAEMEKKLGTVRY